MIKIKDLQKGYTLQYNEGDKQFHVMEGDSYLFYADTQEKVEAKLDRYIKSFIISGCPLKCVTSNGMEETTITSFVADTKEVWASNSKGRGKHRLTNYSDNPQFFELTEGNKAIIAQYKGIESQIAGLHNQLRKLESTLTNPITPEYFNQEVAK